MKCKGMYLGAIMAGAILINPVSAAAGTWEKLGSLFDTTVETQSFSVEAKGWNARAYEWPCVSNPNFVCGFVAGTDKAGAYSYPLPVAAQPKR